MVQVIRQLEPNAPALFLRFRFSKTGALQFISHLDLLRTLHKGAVRAGLPLWYSKGFHPAPKLIFAAPLSIGVESLCEFLDVRLDGEADPAAALAAMQSNFTEELQIEDAYYPQTPFTQLAWLCYRIVYASPGVTAETADRCRAVLSQPTIPVQKRSKEGRETVVDIRPKIGAAEISAGEGTLRISCRLAGNPSDFLNPEIFMKALLGERTSDARTLMSERLSICRTEALRQDLTPFH